MSDRLRSDRRPDDEPEAPMHRLGHHVVGLLEAAREFGDPGLIAQAEAAALSVGHILARSLAREGEDEADR